MKTRLLIIDPQNDFCIPGSSLFVKGADEDMHRLSKCIIENAKEIDEIHVSLDMHNIDDIAHPSFWKDGNGNHPKPFTNITAEDMEAGIWETSEQSDYKITLEYLKNLKLKNKFVHTIWPIHCIAGTYGSNIFPTLLAALTQWNEITKKSFKTYIKGMDKHSEHFGMFQSENINNVFDSKTCINIFYGADNVLVAGEAKSHCVATSLQQIMENYSHSVPKITLLTDTTSDVEGLGHLADNIYKKLRESGMKETTTEKFFQPVI